MGLLFALLSCYMRAILVQPRVTSEVPMPNASEPKAPWVAVWLSPHTMVMPGWVKPWSSVRLQGGCGDRVERQYIERGRERESEEASMVVSCIPYLGVQEIIFSLGPNCLLNKLRSEHCYHITGKPLKHAKSVFKSMN